MGQWKPAYEYRSGDRDDPRRWLKTQARHLLQLKIGQNEYLEWVSPNHLIAFSVDPAEGSEQANFGLCLYPASIVSMGRRIKTKLSGWRWSSFCKTQYASNPDCGGLDNFLRAHVGLVRLLDFAKELGILEKVNDESGYFGHRNAAELIKEIDEWNQMIAGAYGAMKDTLEKLGQNARTLSAEIANYPDFERLEAQNRTDGE